MWINVEVWDNTAKESLQKFRKGAPFHGLGTLIFNKWTDKASGEERKQFKYRLQKLMTADEMALFNDSDIADTEENDSSSKISRTVYDASLNSSGLYDKTKPALSKAVVEVEPVSSQATVVTDLTSTVPAILISKLIASRTYERNLQTNSPLTDRRSQESIDRQIPNQGPTAPSGRSRITYGSYDPDVE